jgi:hypothetical protein
MPKVPEIQNPFAARAASPIPASSSRSNQRFDIFGNTANAPLQKCR